MANYDAISPKEGVTVSTAVAIDRDKNTQHAVRWAIENLRLKEKLIILVHVNIQQNLRDGERRPRTYSEVQQLFLPYRGFCARKGVRTKDVILHNIDIASALSEFIHANSIKNIILGASSRNAITRALKNADIATSVGKVAPDFCSVYAVSKGKAHKIKSPIEPIIPIIVNSSIPTNAFSPDVSAVSSNSSREGCLRSAASELSSFNGGFSYSIRSLDSGNDSSPLSSRNDSREYQQTIPIRPQGSGAPSPPYSEILNFVWRKG